MSGRVGPLKPLTPPFINTYSLDFDGVDDYVDCGEVLELSNAPTVTLSLWMKSTSSANRILLDFKEGTSRITIQRYSNSTIYLYVNNVNAEYSISTALNNWYNIVYVFDGSGATNTDRLKLYVNGIEIIASSFSGTIPTSIGAFTSAMDSKIGSLYDNSFGFRGNIDEVAIFDSVIPIGDLWDGSNQPTDLSDLFPVAWYRMGDNGAYKSPQWLIPNNENKDKVSNYSFEFDGVDDYVDCGNSAALKPNIITVSCWIKGSANSAFTRIISQDGPTGGADAYGFYVTTATNKIVFAIKTNTTGTVTSATSGVVLDNNWHHLVGTYDGSEVILYVDGIAVGSPSAGTSVLSYGSGTLTIGCFSEPTSLPSYLFNGNIDEVSIFDSVIPIGDLWDGSGEPIDVSAVSGLTNNWRMGEEATFSGGVWTVPDAVGSNDGTSNAMTIEDRVGEAPNSENNALSINMDFVDVVPDVP